jgi:hypothetical protein
VTLKDDISNPALILSLVDKSRICIGNDPYITMMAVSSRVPVIFIKTNPSDLSSQVMESISMQNRIIDLNNSSEDDLIKMLFDLQKNYVDSMLEVDDAVKLIMRLEKNSFIPIDKLLTARNKKKPVEKKKGKSK